MRWRARGDQGRHSNIDIDIDIARLLARPWGQQVSSSRGRGDEHRCGGGASGWSLGTGDDMCVDLNRVR